MTSLFAWAGVDYQQWKAISRTLLRADFRAPAGQRTEAHSLRTAGGFLLLFVMYGMFGVGAALVALVNPDVLLSGIVALVYVTFMVVTAVLTQHGATILSTTDYAILGPRPVSSRTFLAVRLTNVLFHTLVLTTMMGYPFVLVETFAHGTSWARGVASLVALYGYAIATTFALVAGYGALLRVAGPGRLQRVLSYAQLAIGVLSYAGVFLVMDRVGRSVLANLTLPRGAWLYFVPPAWFASYIELATGVGDAGAWVRAALSMACVGGLLMLLRGPLAMEYGERLGALVAAGAAADRGASMRRGWWFTRDEARAVALLVRAHFRHDLRVRLGILSVIPMTLFYMFMGARGFSGGGGGDPFLGEQRRGFDFMAMVVLFFPSVLVQNLSGSEAYKASWIYFATPADRAALIVSVKNVIVVVFLGPFVLFLAAIFSWRFGNPVHGFVHAAFMGLIGHLVLQTAVLVQPRLPFAEVPQKSSGNAGLFFWMMAVMLAGTFLLFFLQVWVYRTWTRVVLFAAVLVALGWALNLPMRARAEAADELPSAT